ncbi:MAG: DUF523 domain-containing protein [Eubacteriales bacterium]|jgi:D-alanine-D-alanine ligase
MEQRYWLAASACLCGLPCRYDGRTNPHPELEKWYREGKVLAICPEQLGGLSTPRTPCEITDGRVLDRNGRDRTAEYSLGAQRAWELCRKWNVKQVVLKSKSPSCGCGQVYDGSFTGRLVPGWGVAAALLRDKGLRVQDEKTPLPWIQK